MKKKLIKTGNGWSLFLPKPILELLDIDPETNQVELEISEKVLKIKKSEDNTPQA